VFGVLLLLPFIECIPVDGIVMRVSESGGAFNLDGFSRAKCHDVCSAPRLSKITAAAVNDIFIMDSHITAADLNVLDRFFLLINGTGNGVRLIAVLIYRFMNANFL